MKEDSVQEGGFPCCPADLEAIINHGEAARGKNTQVSEVAPPQDGASRARAGIGNASVVPPLDKLVQREL
jgi:hypothetical protein